MFNKILLLIVLLISVSSQAKNFCADMDREIIKQGSAIAPVWLLLVQSKQRVFFHSAPNEKCKIKDLFIIYNDSVTGYNFYRDSSKQEWIKVIYYSKRQDLENEIVEGWVKFKDLKNIPRDFP